MLSTCRNNMSKVVRTLGRRSKRNEQNNQASKQASKAKPRRSFQRWRQSGL